MPRVLLLTAVVLFIACASPPPPTTAPSTPPPPLPTSAVEERVLYVAASALNVRRDPSTEAAIVTQIRRGTAVTVLTSGESWSRVRLANGTTGWVASQYLSPDRNAAAPTARPSGNCPPDSDYAFVETPRLVFSDRNRPGLVVIEANVNASGSVTRTRVVSNTTGDDALAAIAAREIEGAKFSPPIRNCAPRAFIFTYRRTF